MNTIDYDYNAVGDLTEVSDGSSHYQYSYDDLDRVILLPGISFRMIDGEEMGGEPAGTEMDEQAIIEKLRRIEALFAGAKTEGESAAAASALERMRSRLAAAEAADPPKEFRFSTPSEWSRRLLVALLRRYNIRPYRYRGQRHTTVVAKVSRRFVDETLWPEFCELDKTLSTYLNEVTNRVIREAVHGDVGDAEEREQSKLPGAT